MEIEKAWLRVQCYIKHMHYTWTFERLEHDYQEYYEKGGYCSYTFKDIVKHFPEECKLLFGRYMQE